MENAIFISCGQLTNDERELGMAIKAAVDATPGFVGYFAEDVQSLDALATNILDALRGCAGAIVVLTDRGPLISLDGAERGRRSSVWVNQEIAVLAYRQFVESRKIPILCWRQNGVELEGAMTAFIVNPRPIPPPSEVATLVGSWLAKESFHSGANEVFESKWKGLSEPAFLVLAALVDEGGTSVLKTSVKRTLRDRYDVTMNEDDQIVRRGVQQLTNADLVKTQLTDAGEEFSLHPTWQPQLRPRIYGWVRERKGRLTGAAPDGRREM
jgi:hypothetical protein